MNMISRIPDLKLAVRKRTIGFAVPDAPLMDPEGQAEFEQCIQAASLYLEFGAGGSTIRAALLGKPGISIEGDPHYARDVRRKLKKIPSRINLINVDIGRTKQWGFPQDRAPSEANLVKWAEYVNLPFRELENRFFDLVLIDGRFRVACALRTIVEARKRNAKVRILVDDYHNLDDPRPYYEVIEQYAPLVRLAGRMAVFEIGPEVPGETPTEDVVRAFVGDCR